MVIAGKEGEERGCSGLFAVDGLVVQGTRGQLGSLQKREGGRARHGRGSETASTVVHSALLPPPPPTPARCSVNWP